MEIKDLTKSETLATGENGNIQIKSANFKKKQKTIFTKENILRYFIISIIIAVPIIFFVLYIKCFSNDEIRKHLIVVGKWFWNDFLTSNMIAGFFAGLSFTKFVNWLLNTKK